MAIQKLIYTYLSPSDNDVLKYLIPKPDCYQNKDQQFCKTNSKNIRIRKAGQSDFIQMCILADNCFSSK